VTSLDPSSFRFEALGVQHDRERFSCGIEPLDIYLRQQARQNMRKRVAAVIILTPNGRTIAGYHTLSQYAIELPALPLETQRKLPKYPFVPATLLGRLAVSVAFRGQGLGALLLMDALRRSLDGSRQIASAAVVVDAKDERAQAFYKSHGFKELLFHPRRLFVTMDYAETLVGPRAPEESAST